MPVPTSAALLAQLADWPYRRTFALIVGGSIAASLLGVYGILLAFAPNESAEVWTISLISAAVIPLVVASIAAHLLLSMTDALRRAHSQVEKLANTDALTGALNRRRFSELAQESLLRDHASLQPTSLILIDVDNFKSINDRFGHATGDVVLQLLVASARRVLREQDQLARWGGEEFVVLFPETGSDDAFAIADRLRETIAHEKIEFDGQPIRVTISTGLVTRLSTADPALETLLSEADMAMYAAKTTGKNKVIASPAASAA